ncbi:MAG: sulfatase-like hydrolase/transferase [Desulfobacterales bacterium]|nr:sulfatase-like hydrolase/transferase [Desulfobacterales bacterium]
MFNMNEIVGKNDILFITFDTLRYDVAINEMESGRTPNLKKLLPDSWEKRHSPGNFTYASHHAFFAGFLPTPVNPGIHDRLFAVSFPGSESISPNTCVFKTSSIVSGLAGEGYHTACVGGVGFFNKMSPLGSVFPDMFHESHWHRSYGVTDPDSTENQVKCALDIIEKRNHSNPEQKLFLFINISALHQPNCFYLDNAKKDTLESHGAALGYVDSKLPELVSAFENRGDTFMILSSDHGTTYGEDGYTGHRLSHENVWDVPFASFLHKGNSHD